MKHRGQVLLLFIVVLMAGASVGQAQVTTGTGVVGFTLDKYGRLRVGGFPYASATRHMNRVCPIVALDKNNVMDYTNNANYTSYLPKMITGSGADSAARVIIDNSYPPYQGPKVRVEITVYMWKNAKYLIYRYRVYNDSTGTLPLYIGNFASPSPVNTYDLQTVKYNASKSTYYFYKTGTPVYVSQKLLNTSLYSINMLDWDVYSPTDPASDAATDSMRYAMSTYAKFDTSLTAGVNGTAVQMNAGLFNMAWKDSADVYFGIGIDTTAAGAIALMDSAQAKYNSVLTSVGKITSKVPKNFALEQNYPNPFNPSTQIRFSILQKSEVALTVEDILGRTIATLAAGSYEAGSYSATFDASRFSSGTYFYTLTAGNYRETRKMILMK